MTARLELVVGRQDPDAVARLLNALPEWFGVDEATAEYVESARSLPTVLALDAGTVVGALLWRRHFPGSAEVHLMAVDRSRHRHGIGTALLDRAERELRSDGVRYLQVKTLGPSCPDTDYDYDLTRRFYQARGFVPIEEFLGFWDDEPMLLLVKAL